MLVNAFTRYLFSIFYRGCNRPKSIHFEFRTAKLRLLFDTGVNSRIIVGFFRSLLQKMVGKCIFLYVNITKCCVLIAFCRFLLFESFVTILVDRKINCGYLTVGFLFLLFGSISLLKWWRKYKMRCCE